MGRRAHGTGKFVKNNIRALREKIGMSQTELSRLSGLSTSQLSRLELQRRRFSLDIADKLAPHLQCTRAAITQDVTMDDPVMRVTVTGQLQDGDWKELFEWPNEDRYEIVVRETDRYAGIERHGSEVVGHSMNKAFPEDTILAWVPFDEIDEPLLPGKRYVISRQREDGLREFTVRTHMRDREGNDWFYPESIDPAFQIPVALEDPKVKVIVVGRVTDAIITQL